MTNKTNSDDSVTYESEAPMDAISAPQIITPNSPPRLEPTRYGDWEKAGRCIDF